jgi:hypothetical protein
MEENNLGFTPIDTSYKEEDPEPNEFGFTPIEAKPYQPVITPIVEAGKGFGRVAGRAAISGAAAPSKTIGGLLDLLGSIYPEDEGFRGAPRKGIKGLGDIFTQAGEGGQEYLKGLLEDALGESYSTGEEALAGFSEKAADLYARGPFKGTAIPSLIGGAAGQAAKSLGLSEGAQSAAEMLGFGSRDIAKGLKSLVPEKIVEKSGLILPKIIEKTKEGMKFLTPRSFAGSKKNAYEKVSKQAEEMIADIRKRSLPISEEFEKGVNVEARLNKDLNKVDSLASKMENKIESSFVSDYLDSVEKKIRSVPVPSEEEREILKLVDTYRKQFGTSSGGSRFYSPKQYVDQYRKVNKDAKTLYETSLAKGKRTDTRKFYEGVNDSIEKTLVDGTPKEFSELFKQTNAEYSQVQKLQGFENTLSGVMENGVIDSKKLRNIFRSPSKSKALRGQIGSEGFDRLRLISNDLSKVQSKLGLVKEMGLMDLVKSGSSGLFLNKIGMGFAIPFQVGKKISDVAVGEYLLSDKGYRDWASFYKALQSGSKKSVEASIRNLDKSFSEYEDSINPDKKGG